MFYFLGSCGSTHLIELAEQIHKKAGRVRAARPRSRARIAPAFFFGIRSKAWFRSSVCSFRTDTIKKKAFVSRYKRIMGQKPVTSAVPPKLTYKNVHSVVCKHTRSLGNGGIPVSHTLPADLRLPSQVHSATSFAALLTPPESSLEARSRSYSLLFCGFAFSEISIFPR